MKVTARFLALVLACVVLLTAVTSYLAVWRSYRRYEMQQERVVRWIHGVVAEEVTSAYRRQGVIGVEQVLTRLSLSESGLRLKWIRLDSTYLPASSPDPGGNHLVTRMEQAPGSREWYLSTRQPIQVDNQLVGALELETSLQQWQRENYEAFFTSLALLGSFALLAVGTVYVAGIRWVADPLERLIAQAQRMGRGDFDGTVQLNRSDELGQLAATLNESCRLLKEQQTKLDAETKQKLQALEQLQHADRLRTIGKLAAGIAHELGTPLAVISGRASSLAREGLTSEQIDSHAKAIKGEADRMADIIRQLLDFSRTDEARRRITDLRRVVQQTVSLLEPIAQKQSLSLKVSVPDTPADADVDPKQIQQVLTNLIMNAIQASPGSTSITISLQPDQNRSDEEMNWQLSVEDQGPGIELSTVEQVFEPFFTTKQTGEGTGLGLPIARRLIEDNDGTIEVETQPGKGTIFTCSFPRKSVS